jgi:hypothetical protein
LDRLIEMVAKDKCQQPMLHAKAKDWI